MNLNDPTTTTGEVDGAIQEGCLVDLTFTKSGSSMRSYRLGEKMVEHDLVFLERFISLL